MIAEITLSIVLGVIMGILVPKIIIRIEDYYIRKKAVSGLEKNTFYIDGKKFSLPMDENVEVKEIEEKTNEIMEENNEIMEEKELSPEKPQEERDYEDKEEIRDYEQEEIDSGAEDTKQ